MKFLSIVLSVLLMFSNMVSAQTFKSSVKQTQWIELFSSQGCSSCPPAEHWISTLKNKKALAIWLNEPNKLQPIQAVGGWIN